MQRYRGVPVLVTGASGFIGQWVCRRLVAAGAAVTAPDRTVADLSRPGALAALIDAHRPAITFNLAGYGVDRHERDGMLMTRLNADLPVEAAEALAAAGPLPGWDGLRLLHVGSVFEYGTVRERITEDTAPRPASDYGRTKLAGTRRIAAVAARSALPAATARVCQVYGPGEHAHRLLPSLLRATRTGETLELTAGEPVRDFTYVEDVAEGLLRLGLQRAVPGGVVNLATGVATTVRDFIGHARTCLGLRDDQLRLGATPYRADEIWQGPIDVNRLRTLLDWVPATPVPVGIRRTVEALSGVAA